MQELFTLGSFTAILFFCLRYKWQWSRKIMEHWCQFCTLFWLSVIIFIADNILMRFSGADYGLLLILLEPFAITGIASLMFFFIKQNFS